MTRYSRGLFPPKADPRLPSGGQAPRAEAGIRWLIPAFAGMTFLLSHTVSAAVPDTVFQELLEKARTVVSKSDKKKSDFYIARYLGLASHEEPRVHGVEDIKPIIDKKKLAPKAFVSGHWDPGFIEWFEQSIAVRWGVPEERVREKARSFEIANASYQDKFFVTVVAYPELELWYVVENGLVTRPLYMLMGSVVDRPTVFFGRIFKGFSSFQFSPLYLETRKRQLHYVWKPEFHDLDGDGQPEVWLRYNLSWGNGFAQVLEIYRTHNDSELILLKRFVADYDGVARRLADGRIELAYGAASKSGMSRLDFDSHRFETWEYRQKDKTFHKTSEEVKPTLFKDSAWREYFLEQDVTSP